MKYDLVLLLWLYVTIVSSFNANHEDDKMMMGQGLYMETKDLHRRKLGPPTYFGSSLKSTHQLENYKLSHQSSPSLLTQSNGIPVGDIENALTVGPYGPMLLQDAVFLDEMAHFDRERIPERVVHAKGAGAFGYFEVTHDITKYSKAIVFSEIGKRTDIVVRFSQVIGESGSSDTVRDPRGFAIKFYTEQGNWDLTGNNTPIFFIRDPLLFSNFIHSQKRNPKTHLKDANAFWDFITLEPETVHQLMILFSDRGIPDGYRHMNGFGSHTFKLVNATGSPVYCKFHYITDQGVEGLDPTIAAQLAGTTPDYALKDLYDAIASKQFPSWSFFIQVMTFKQAEEFHYNPFDLTKVWPHGEYPLIPVGRLVLDRNPVNYFAEVEQLAFNPASMIPGIEPSPDKILQGRLFAYADTQRYRLGANVQQIPVNCPYRTKVRNYQRDGPMTVTDNQGDAPNYYPNSFSGPDPNKKYLQSRFYVTGDVACFNSTNEDNFEQPALFWTKVLKAPQRGRLVNNLAEHLINAEEFLQERAFEMFSKVHVDFGQMLRKAVLKLRMQQVFTEWNFIVPEMKEVFNGLFERFQ